jgi:micrococcal nuclease
MRMALAALWLSACCAIAAGRVEVIDGDTLRLADGQLAETVRLWGIDAPELDQPGGKEARAELARRCGPPATVTIDRRGKDARGRTLAQLRCNGEDAGLALISAGLAWAYTAFSPPGAYVDAQQAAKTAQRGIWQAPGALPPWDWRQRKR